MLRRKLMKIIDEAPPQEADFTRLMLEVNDAVLEERARQNEQYGNRRQDTRDWLTIAVEEVGEVAQAMQANKGWGKTTDAQDLYTECIHASAVFSAFAEQIKEERGL
jgi:NTP pyrophosphatase (non-canonical NTP hydrolase)